jgi:hypothetical protein
VKAYRLAGHSLVLKPRAPTLIHPSQRGQVRRSDAEWLPQVPPQRRRHDAHRFEEAPGHAQEIDLERQCELGSRTAPIVDNE